MVLKGHDKSYETLVKYHTEVLNQLKTQKIRSDKQFEHLKGKIVDILNVPSNKFLDWAVTLESFINGTVNSKINDIELIKQYNKYISELVAYQTKTVDVAEQIAARNIDYDLLANSILKLENALMESQEDLEDAEKAKEESLLLSRDLETAKDDLKDHEVLIDELQNELEASKKKILDLERANEALCDQEKLLEELKEAKLRILDLEKKPGRPDETSFTSSKTYTNIQKCVEEPKLSELEPEPLPPNEPEPKLNEPENPPNKPPPEPPKSPEEEPIKDSEPTEKKIEKINETQPEQTSTTETQTKSEEKIILKNISPNFTEFQIKILKVLAENPRPQTEIADELNTTSSTIFRSLERLKRERYVIVEKSTPVLLHLIKRNIIF